MKNFMKKLAFVMALALVLTSLSPAASAFAAAKDMKMNVSSKIIYLGESDISGTAAEYDFYIKNKPSNYKKLYTFKWTSSNPKVATVNGSGLTQAVTTGKTTITCTITDKKTGDVVITTKATVTVKQNAKAVSIYNYPEDKTAEVGEVIDFNRKMTPKTGKGSATDKTKWVFLENTAGAKVTQSNGKVTTTKAGSYTIIAYTYQSSSYPLEKDDEGNYTNFTSVSKPVTITVTDPEAEVKPTPTPTPTTAPTPTPAPEETEPIIRQTSVNAFNIKFDKDMSKTITKANLSIRDQYGSQQFISALAFAPDGKTLYVELYNVLENEKKYSVVYGTASHTFVASAGAPAIIELVGVKDTLNKVAPGEPGTLEYKLYDQNGVSVPKPATAYVSYQIINDTYDGYIVDDKITIWTKDKAVTVKAVYHTGNFNLTTGVEVTFESNPFTVISVEKVAPTFKEIVGATISSTNVTSLVNFTDTTTTICADEEGKYLVVKAVDTAGNIIYINEFSSANVERLIVDTTSGMLYPIPGNTGETDILCYVDGRVVGVVTINVLPARKATFLTSDKNSIVLSNSPLINDNATFTLTLKDQYGEEMPINSLTAVKSNPNQVNEPVPHIVGNTITFYGNSVAAGTYVYRVSTADGTVSTNVTVHVRQAGTTPTMYSLSSNYAVVDMKISENSVDRTLVLSLNGYDSSNVKVNAYSGHTLTITDMKTNTIVSTFVTNESGQVSIPIVIGSTKLFTKGTYRVSCAPIPSGESSIAVQPITFTITDTQPAPIISLTKTNFEVALNSNIYDILLDTMSVVTNIGAEYVTLTMDDTCVIGPITGSGGICNKLGSLTFAIKQVYVIEHVGTAEIASTFEFESPLPISVVVK